MLMIWKESAMGTVRPFLEKLDLAPLVRQECAFGGTSDYVVGDKNEH